MTARADPQEQGRSVVVLVVGIPGAVMAIRRHARVVIESRGTYAWLRRLVAACARTRGREAVIILVDTPSGDAMAGQVGRGRVVLDRAQASRVDDLGELVRGPSEVDGRSNDQR